MGIHAMRHLKVSQKKRNSRLAKRKNGKVMPTVDSKGWSAGLTRSLYPTRHITTTVAMLAPASI